MNGLQNPNGSANLIQKNPNQPHSAMDLVADSAQMIEPLNAKVHKEKNAKANQNQIRNLLKTPNAAVDSKLENNPPHGAANQRSMLIAEMRKDQKIFCESGLAGAENARSNMPEMS
jgi:hypothetical protein